MLHRRPAVSAHSNHDHCDRLRREQPAETGRMKRSDKRSAPAEHAGLGRRIRVAREFYKPAAPDARSVDAIEPAMLAAAGPSLSAGRGTVDRTRAQRSFGSSSNLAAESRGVISARMHECTPAFARCDQQNPYGQLPPRCGPETEAKNRLRLEFIRRQTNAPELSPTAIPSKPHVRSRTARPLRTKGSSRVLRDSGRRQTYEY